MPYKNIKIQNTNLLFYINMLININAKQIIVIIVTLILIVIIVRNARFYEAVHNFSRMIKMVGEWIDDPDDVKSVQLKDDVAHVVNLYHKKGYRFTLIRGDGVVLLDGALDHRTMKNQLSQPEIQDALIYGQGVAMRKSHHDIQGAKALYVAETVDTNYGTLYIRLSAAPSVIRTEYHKTLVSLLITSFLSGILIANLC